MAFTRSDAAADIPFDLSTRWSAICCLFVTCDGLLNRLWTITRTLHVCGFGGGFLSENPACSLRLTCRELALGSCERWHVFGRWVQPTPVPFPSMIVHFSLNALDSRLCRCIGRTGITLTEICAGNCFARPCFFVVSVVLTLLLLFVANPWRFLRFFLDKSSF